MLNNQADDAEDTVQLVNIPTAISLLSFDAKPAETGIQLTWQTAIEFDNFGFKLMRADTNQLDDAIEVTFISGQGAGTNTGTTYAYLDNTAQVDQAYTYWLVDVDLNGLETIHKPVTLTTLNTINADLRYYLPFISR